MTTDNKNDGGVAFIRALAGFLSDYADAAEGVEAKAPIGSVDPNDAPKEAKKTTARKGAASKAKEVEEEPVVDAPVGRAAREAELKKARITSLKKIAKEAGFEPEDIDGAEKAELIEALLDDEFPEDGDDAADDATDESEAEEYTEAILKKTNIKELRRIAVEEKGAEKEDVEDADKAEIIEFILSEDDGDDVDEEEEKDDDEEEYLTEADLKKMDLKQLKVTAKEYGVKPPIGIKAPALIDLILAAGDED